MKRFLSMAIGFTLAMCTLTSNAQFMPYGGIKSMTTNASVKSTLELKYCTSNIDDGIGTGKADNLKAAIKIPASMVSSYSGTRIVKINVGIYKLPVSNAKVWISSVINGSRLVEQAFTPVLGWNEITLTTPFEITSGNLFIGYDIKVDGVGEDAYVLGISRNEPNANAGNIALENSWMTFAENNITGNLAIIAEIDGTPKPYLDVQMIDIDLPQYIKVNSEVTLSGMFYNNSNEVLTSYDVDCIINDNYTGTYTFNYNVNVGIGERGIFSFPDPILFDTEGLYSIELKISEINGSPDNYPNDNAFLKQTNVYSANNLKKRKTVMEHFTTEKCPNCPDGEAYLKSVVGNNPDIIWVANHSGFNTDQYTVTEKYTWFYNERGSTYAPAIMLNRTNLASKGAEGISGLAPGPVFGLGDYVPELLSESLKTPTFVSVNIGDGVYDDTTRELNFTVAGNKIQDLAGYNTVLNVFLIENNLKSNQPGIDKHQHVLRQIVSELWGDKVNFEEANYSMHYSVILNEAFVTDEISIVAFLSNYDSENPNNCEIHNGEVSKFNDIFTPIGVTTPINQVTNIYPNPAKDIVNIIGDYTSISIYDLTGKVIKIFDNKSVINISDIANGVYIMSLSHDNNTYTKKLIIRR